MRSRRAANAERGGRPRPQHDLPPPPRESVPREVRRARRVNSSVSAAAQAAPSGPPAESRAARRSSHRRHRPRGGGRGRRRRLPKVGNAAARDRLRDFRAGEGRRQGELDFRGGPHQRQVAGRGDPELTWPRNLEPAGGQKVSSACTRRRKAHAEAEGARGKRHAGSGKRHAAKKAQRGRREGPQRGRRESARGGGAATRRRKALTEGGSRGSYVIPPWTDHMILTRFLAPARCKIRAKFQP